MIRHIIFLLLLTFSMHASSQKNFVFNERKRATKNEIIGIHKETYEFRGEKTSLDINQFMNKVIKKYQSKIIKEPYLTKAHYREKSKIYGNYQMYTEGIGYLISLGYDYYVQRDNFSFLCSNMKKSDRKKQWLELLQNLYNDSRVTKQTDFPPGYNSLFSCFRRFETKGPLSKTGELEYAYNQKETIKKQGKTLYKIGFKPKNIESSSEQRYYKGSFFINSKTLNISRIIMNVAPFYSQPFRRWIKKANLTINYEYINNKLIFSHLDSYYKVDGVEHWVEFNVTETQIHELEISSKKNKDKFTMHDRNPRIYYNENKWNIYKYPKEKNMKTIRKELGKNISLEQQYKNNSNKPFYEANYPGNKKYEEKRFYDYMKKQIEKYDEKYN